jgi:tetratricopeptide (TPR) repeat protein
MKLKIFKVVALVFLVVFSLNFIGIFFLNLSTLSMNSLFDNDDNLNDKKDNRKEKLEDEVAYYTFKLDSIIEINPLQAELFADKLLLTYKNNEEFLRYKAISLSYQDKYQESLNLYKHILDSNKRNIYDEFNMGICYEKLKKYDSAIHFYSKAEYDNYEFRIASCYKKSNQKDSAQVYYKKVITELQKNGGALRNFKDIDFIKFKIDSLQKAK